MTRTVKAFTEVAQFVPIITLASSFIVKGSVDMNQASVLFVVSGIMAVAVTIWLLAIRITLNPILLASNIWLVFGAVAFGIPIPLLADLFGETNAALLFAAVLAVGITQTTLRVSTGFIGLGNASPQTIRKLSMILLGVAALAFCWAMIFRDNIRVGGGLPFIVLNVVRRILIKRGARCRIT